MQEKKVKKGRTPNNPDGAMRPFSGRLPLSVFEHPHIVELFRERQFNSYLVNLILRDLAKRTAKEK